MALLNPTPRPGRTNRSVSRPGLTLIELLVASLILVVSLTGMISVWAYMINGTIITDERAGAYECARLVLERARSMGYSSVIPTTSSAPAPGNSVSGWTSPHLLGFRYYDANIQELGGGSNVEAAALAAQPANARYYVETTFGYANVGGNSRPDLNMLGYSVKVTEIDRFGVIPRDVNKRPIVSVQLQTALTEGGI